MTNYGVAVLPIPIPGLRPSLAHFKTNWPFKQLVAASTGNSHYNVSQKTAQLCNGIARNGMDRF